MRRPTLINMLSPILVVAASFFLLLLIYLVTEHNTEHPLKQRVSATYSNLGTYNAGAKLFCLTNERFLVHSAYTGEENLLGSSGYDSHAAVDDIDYGLPWGYNADGSLWGSHERVCIPGFKTDFYPSRGAVKVEGSGLVAMYTTPNGGNFATLHMYSLTTPVVATIDMLHLPVVSTGPNKSDGDGRTAQAVAIALKRLGKSPPTAYGLHGGQTIGLSGWPTDPFYGNGSYGPPNSHLCFLLDARSADWFESILNGTHRKPVKPFNAKVWNQYRLEHRLRAISFENSKGKATHVAQLWSKHKPTRTGGIVKTEVFEPHGKHGVDGDEKDVFQGYDLYYWPRHKNWKPKWVSHKWIR